MAEIKSVAPLSPGEVANLTEESPNFFTTFSNNFRMNMSATEFRFIFGQSSLDATGRPKVVENVAVVVTPPQAKFILEMLANSIATIEQAFGPIPTLQELVAKRQPEVERAAAAPTEGTQAAPGESHL